MSTSMDQTTLFFSPPRRGADDSIRSAIEDVLENPAHFFLASQQMADRDIVSKLVSSVYRSESKARVFVESKYLFERHPVPVEEIWESRGKNEDHRQCLLALTRAGLEVRTDLLRNALQHTNFIASIAATRNMPSVSFFTSANFAPGSIDRHLNWAFRCPDEGLTLALKAAFQKAWDGDFRDARIAQDFKIDGDDWGRLRLAADGQVLDDILEVVNQARTRLHFAFFNISTSSAVVEALAAATERGVDVHGVVDGDQGHQRWNAVPGLQSAGVDVRYYPGAMTGAAGRMHYKMIAADDDVAHLGTANLSAAAERSLELGLLLRAGQFAHVVRAEVERLLQNASVTKFDVVRTE